MCKIIQRLRRNKLTNHQPFGYYNYIKNRIGIAFVVMLLFAGNGFADTHTVSGDCSASAVQSAINAASAGDIIDVACTGTVTWSSYITVSGGKTLKAGGAKGASGTAGNWPLTINVTYSGSDYPLIRVVNDNNQPVNRVTGFKFQGTGAPNWIIMVVGRGTGSDGKGAFRIDNNFFNEVSYNSRVTYTDGTTGKLTGLFDHNVFYYLRTSTPKPYGNNSYQNSYKGSSGTCYGYDSLHRDGGFGTDDFVFWENNYMHDSALETSDGGGRVVVRYNEFASDYTDGSIAGLDGHGADTGGHNACGIVANEFYKNTMTGSQAYAQVVDMRGGKWMVHNNTTQSGYLQINEYRVSGPQYLDWKTCSGSFCCPTTPPQCNIQAPTAGDFSACYPLPNQVQNTYVWNNLKNGTNMTPAPVGGASGLVAVYVALNRDYWMPTYGTEANLPDTCTANDDTYYGATDTGKLYKCTALNTWTPQYTPYTYPHPLSLSSGASNNGGGGETPVQPVTLTVSSDHGTVSSEPTGINCGATCSALYDSGSEVTLTMGTVAAGYTFQGWQGDCTGTGITCTVTMNAAKTVTAQFAVNTYALTVSKAGTGSGTVTSAPVGISCGSDCANDYVAGTQVTLTADPNSGSRFIEWQGACTGYGTCTVTMDAAKSVTAKFDAEYTLTVSKPYAAAGTVADNRGLINCGTSCASASASYIQGTSVTLHPETAGEGYIFEGWTGGICTGNGDCTVTMDVSKSVTAQFSVRTSDLNVEKSGTGTGRVTGDNGRIDCGQTCSATYEYEDSFTLAAAASSGSDFAGWSGDCSGTAPCLVSMTAPRTVNAIFTLSPISQYVLTLINDGNGNGSVSSNPGGISNCSDTCQANYDSNVSVELTPAPLDDSTFAGWSGACTGKAACIVSMTAARSVTATFTLIPPPSNYTLTLVKDGDGPGTVSSSPAGITCGATCSADFAEDISVVLTASPVNGTSNFAGWTGDCAGTGATCSVPMTKARSVTARFTLIPPPSNYALTVLKDGYGSGNVVSTPAGIDCGATCSANFTSGASVQLTATPITDHTFGGWSGDCTGTGVCQVTMNATKSVRATFVKPNAIVLLIKKIGRGLGRIKSTNLYASVSPDLAGTDIDCGDVCAKEYDVETTVTLSAEPEQGYSFAGWSGACSGTGACTVTVSEVTSVTANFVANEVDSGSPAPVGAGGGGGGGGGCFIATAAYGSYLDPHVMVLREFRDKVLLKNKYGRMFVAFYYKNSPAIADRISRIESLRLLTRLALTPMVYAMAYPMAAAMILLAGLLLIEIAVRRKKQVKSIPLATTDPYFQRGPRGGFVRVR